MYVSHETSVQTEARLRSVLAGATLEWLEGDHAFAEFPVTEFPFASIANALAFVRDDEVWSVLIPSKQNGAELFAVFSVHFGPALDNSGFVGWLASRFKRELGTGVFVVCGQNSERGGIFDYWGVPTALRMEASTLLAQLAAG